MTDSLLYIPDAMTAPASWPPTEPLALDNGYEPDPFQKHAILGIHAGDHVFVTAKTGSGKTFVGEYLIARALAAGKRVFYTSPIKSLSNQKYHDLKKLFPTSSVGVLTGDIKMEPDAQIVVMTAEILRNLFYKRGTATEGVGLTSTVSLEGVAGIVIDEAHYIQDPDRGHVWEETLILCPRDIQLVLLSATMPSAESLAGWLARIHERRVWLLNTTYRVVPLIHGILRHRPTAANADNYEVAVMLDAAGYWDGDAYAGWQRDRRAIQDAADAHAKAVAAAKRSGGGGGSAASGPGTYWSRAAHDTIREASSAALREGKARVESPQARLRRTVSWLKERGQLPALFFIFSRKECERLAGQIEESFLDGAEASSVTHIMDFHLSRHKAALETSPQYHRLRDLLIRGVAFHHSGLQPLLKEIVEILFSRGLVRVLFATETFSVGLNMPTKTVVFLELRKFADGGEQRLLRPDEYIQMAGRAGRRGKDTQGLVLYEPLREPVESSELRGLLTGALPPLESRMRFHYDFILRHRLTGGKVPIAELSYWAEQQKEARAATVREIARIAGQLGPLALSAEEHEAFAAKETLEERVRTTRNAAQRKAKMDLAFWEEAHEGPRWIAAATRYKKWLPLKAEHDRLVLSVTEWDAKPLLALDPQEAALRDWGFLAADNTLTGLGVCATEVAEGHNILMPLLAVEGRLTEMTAEEIACVLAGFLREGGDSEAATLEGSGLRHEVLDALYWVDDRARALQRSEREPSPESFWALSALWVCVTARYVAGYTITQIAEEFGLFEGNVQRGLMRVANLVEEWSAICEIRRDLVGLEKVRALRLLRDDIVVDSLYLRL
jgi:superfamily II RNA helicase